MDAQEAQLNKSVYQACLERAKGKCELCGFERPLSLHHIFGRPSRGIEESEDTCIMLCKSCHQGTYGVHGAKGGALNKRVKILAQKRMLKKYSEEEVRQKTGGRIYVEEL